MKEVETTVCYLCGKPLSPQRLQHRVQNREDCFVRSLMPFARGSVAGDAIYAKALTDFRDGEQVPLMTMVLNEFDRNPNGLVLPDGKVVKRFDGKRIRRVAWKMVRGLHFHHTGAVLPENWPP